MKKLGVEFSNKLVVIFLVLCLLYAGASAQAANMTFNNSTEIPSNFDSLNVSQNLTSPQVPSGQFSPDVSSADGSLYRSLDYELDERIVVKLSQLDAPSTRVDQNATWSLRITIENTASALNNSQSNDTIPVYLTISELLLQLNNTALSSIDVASLGVSLYLQKIILAQNISATLWQEVSSQLIAYDAQPGETRTYLVEFLTPAPRLVWVESAFEDNDTLFWSGIVALSTPISQPYDEIIVPVDVPLSLQSQQPEVELNNFALASNVSVTYDQATLEARISNFVAQSTITFSFNISKNSTKYLAMNSDQSLSANDSTPISNLTPLAPVAFFDRAIDDITITDTQQYVLDLSQYISKEISTQYSILYPLLDNISIELNDSLLYFIPDVGYNGTQTFQFFADDGQTIHETNLFNITVVSQGFSNSTSLPSITQIISDTYETVQIGEPVVWKKRIPLSLLRQIVSSHSSNDTLNNLNDSGLESMTVGVSDTNSLTSEINITQAHTKVYLPQNASNISLRLTSDSTIAKALLDAKEQRLKQSAIVKSARDSGDASNYLVATDSAFVDKTAQQLLEIQQNVTGSQSNRLRNGINQANNGVNSLADAVEPEVVEDVGPGKVQSEKEKLEIEKRRALHSIRDTATQLIATSTELKTQTARSGELDLEQLITGHQTTLQLNTTSLLESVASSDAENDGEYLQIEYVLPGPTLRELSINHSKKVVEISSETHYGEIVTTTELPIPVLRKESVRVIWQVDANQSQRRFVDFNLTDTTGDGTFDTVTWITPHLSTQIFEIIVITNAEELDVNRSYIRDVYPLVSVRDGNFSTIADGNFVRVKFAQPLTSDNDITIYAKSLSPGATVVVYEKDGIVPIADFGPVTNDEKYQIFLTSLSAEQDVFDLQVVGGTVDFDLIIDPHLVVATTGMLAYGVGTTQAPHYRFWTGTSFGGAHFNSSSMGGTTEWMRMVASPRNYEYLMATADAGDDINVQVYFYNTSGQFCWGNGTYCNATIEVTAASTTANQYKMDVAYEQLTGKGMIAYSDGTAIPKYRLWNGSVWSAEASIAESYLTGTIEIVRLASRPGTNEISAMFTDSNDDLTVIVWDGSTWACEPTAVLATTLVPDDQTKADMAYESLSGELLIAFDIDATTDIRVTNKSATICGFTSATKTLASLEPEGFHLSAEEGTNYIIISESSSSNDDTEFSIWNGTDITVVSSADTNSYNEAAPNMIVAGAFAGRSRTAIGVYSDQAASTVLDYKWYNVTTNAWTGGAAGLDAAGLTAFTSEEQNYNAYTVPLQNRSLIIVQDNSNDLWAKMFNGNAISFADADGGAALTSDSGNGEFPAFAFAWQLTNDTTRPNISYILPTPGNGTNLSMNYIFINLTVNETNQANITFYLFNYSSFSNSLTAYGGLPYQLNRWDIVNNTRYSTQNFYNFTGLSDGLYLFNVSISDLRDNINFTPHRVVRIDSNAPTISYSTPTPAVNTYQAYNYTDINLSIDEHQPINVTFSLNGTRTTLYNDSIILQYDFDNLPTLNESTSNILDSSLLGTNNGSTSGAPVFTTSGRYRSGLTLDGVNDYVVTNNQYTNPQSFSVEMWFKTATGNGGKLAGFGNVLIGTSANYDRHIYMLNNGTLAFGVYNGATQTVRSRVNLNNNAWHQVVATLTGGGTMSIYVDGVLHNSLAGISAEVYNGYWRMGYDSLTGWPDVPTSLYFNGDIDAVRVFNVPLNASEVAFRYNSTIYRKSLHNWEANITLSNLGQGTYNYIACANDTNYASGCSTVRNITIDWTTPTVSFVDFTDVDGSNTSRSWLSFNVSANDSFMRHMNLSIYNSALTLVWRENFSFGTGYSKNLSVNRTTLVDGLYWYNGSATDWSGQVGNTTTRNITIDTINPNITYVGYTDIQAGNFSRNWFAINVSANDTNLNRVNISVYNSALTLLWQQNYSVPYGTITLNLSLNMTNMVDGFYWFNASALDRAGNINRTATYNITLDTINPNITYVGFTETNGSNLSRNWFAINVSVNDTNMRWINITVYNSALTLIYVQNYSAPFGTISNNLSLNMTNMINGVYWFNASAIDWAGNINRTSTYNVTIDNINPNISFVSYTELNGDNRSKSWISFNVSVNDTNLREINLSIYNAALTLVWMQNYSVPYGTSIENLSVNRTSLVDGLYWFNASATDRAGNINRTATYNITLDTINPNISYVFHTELNGSNLSRTWFDINVSANDTNLHQINISVYNNALVLVWMQNYTFNYGVTANNFSYNATNMVDGIYWFNATVYDRAGNWNGTSLYNVTLDTLYPNLSFVSATDYVNVTRDWIQINVTANDTNMRWVNISFYSSSGALIWRHNFTTVSATENLSLNRTSLAEGNYSFNASVMDWTGKVTNSSTYNITVDTINPNISFVPFTEIDNDNLSRIWIGVNITANDTNLRWLNISIYNNANTLVWVANYTAINAFDNFTFNFTTTFDGTFNFNATATDWLGRTNSTSTRNVTIDTIRPNITYVGYTDINGGNFSRTWFAINVSANDTNLQEINITVFNSAFALIWMQNYSVPFGVTTENLSLNMTSMADGRYWFNASVTDRAGIKNQTALYNITLDTINPNISFVGFTELNDGNFSKSNIAINVSANDTNLRWINISIYDAALALVWMHNYSLPYAVTVENLSLNLTGLVNGLYWFNASATDWAGNINRTATYNVTLDTINPNISYVSYTEADGNVFSRTWFVINVSANDTNLHWINISVYNSSLSRIWIQNYSVPFGTTTENLSLNMTSMLDGTYWFNATATDRAGNINFTSTYNVTLDTVSPNISYVSYTELNGDNRSKTWLSINVTVNDTNLRWMNISVYNSALTLIWRHNYSLPAGVVSENLSLNLTNLVNGLYWFNASVVDDLGNVNQTATYNITLDTINPNITYVGYTDVNFANLSRDWFAINVSVNDTNLKWFNISVYDGAFTLLWQQNYSVPFGTAIENLSLNMTNMPNGLYWFNASATDWAGNFNYTRTYNVTLETINPNISYIAFTEINGDNASRSWLSFNVSANDTNLRWINLSIYDAALTLVWMENYTVSVATTIENLSLNRTNLINGLYWFNASATDWAGNINRTATYNITLDNINPNISFVSHTETNNSVFSRDWFAINVSVNDTTLRWINISVYDNLFTLLWMQNYSVPFGVTTENLSLNMTSMSDGVYWFNASVTDWSGNFNKTQTYTVIIDSAEPNISFVPYTELNNGNYSKNWLAVNVSANDSILRWINISVYNGALSLIWVQNYSAPFGVTTNNLSLNLTSLIDGLYWFNATVTDWAGNLNWTPTYNVTLDTINPNITYVGYTETNASNLSRNWFAINVSTNDTNLKWLNISVYDSASTLIWVQNYSIAYGTTIENLSLNMTNMPDGRYWFNANATDWSGNTNQTPRYNVTLDTINPNISYVAFTEVFNDNLTRIWLGVNVSANDSNLRWLNISIYSSSNLLLWIANYSVPFGVIVENFSLNYTTVSDDTFYFNATATDWLGHTNSTPTYNVTLDTVYPNISYIPFTDIHNDNVSRNWIGINISANDTTLRTLNISVYSAVTPNSLIWVHNYSTFATTENLSLNLTGLNDGVYWYNGSATDFSGRTNYTSTRNITIDTFNPNITYVPATDFSNVTRNWIQINVTTNDTNLRWLNISFYNSSHELLWVVNRTAASSFENLSLNMTGLVDGVYYFNATSLDWASRTNSTTTYNVSVDTINPNVSYVEYTDINGGNFSRNWFAINISANDTNLKEMNITVYNNAFTMLWMQNYTVPIGVTRENLSLNMTNMVDGIYWFNATAIDWTGHTNKTATYNVTLDTINPNISYVSFTNANGSNLSQSWIAINVTANDTNLNWINISVYNSALALVWQQNYTAPYGVITNNLSLNLTGLIDGVYWFNATTTDRAGNTNKTQTYNLTLDATNPNISYVGYTDINGANLSRDWFAINVSANDTNLKWLNISVYNSALTLLWQENYSLPLGVSTENLSLNMTNMPNGRYWFNASATDWAGNINRTQTYNVTLDTINPNISYVAYTEQNNGNYSKIWIGVNVSVNDTNLRWINVSIFNSALTLVYQQNYSVPFGVLVENLSFNYTTSVDGVYWFNASVTDWAGHFNYTPTYNVTIDTLAPQIAYISPTEPNGLAVNRSWIFVNVSVTEINLQNVTIWLYNASGDLINSAINTTNGITYHEYNFSGLIDGFYAFNVTAIDTANNRNATLTRYVLIDTVVPNIYFVPPTRANNTFTNVTYYPVNITVANSTYISTFTYNWNGTDFSIYNSSLLLMMNFENKSSLGENATTVVDLASRGYGNATIVGTPTWRSNAKFGGAYNLSGTQYMVVQDNDTQALINPSGTVNIWFYHAGLTGSDGGLIHKGNRSDFADETFSLQFRSGTQLGYYLGGVLFSTTTLPTVNQWHMLTATWTPTQKYFYIDGVLKVSTASAAAATDGDGSLQIGCQIPAQYCQSGLYDELLIFNGSLTNAQVQQLYMSNLQKYNQTTWYFYANQTFNATTGLTDGNYTYYGYVNDTAANANMTETRLVKVDATKPQIAYIPLTETNDSYLAHNFIQINVSVNESNFANTTINLYNNVGALVNSYFNDTVLNNSANFTVTVDGVYYFNATTIDLAENANHTFTYNVTVDTINPNISYVAYTEINDGNYTKNWLGINISANDTNLKWLNISVYNSALTLVWQQNYTIPSGVSIENLSLNLTPLADDFYWFNATVVDRAGNFNYTQTYNVTLDSINPNISYVGYTDINAGNFSRDWFAINVTANDTNLRWINISVYNATLSLIYIQNYSVPFGVTNDNLSLNMTSMIDGLYWFNASVVDWAGNTNRTATYNVTLDTINPLISYVGEGSVVSNVTNQTLFGSVIYPQSQRTNSAIELNLSHLTVNSPGLLVYMPFDVKEDSTSNIVYDYSSNNNDGVVTGGALYNSSGKYGSAYTLDGVNDAINIGKATYLDNVGEYTYSFWINPHSLADTFLFFRQGAGNPGQNRIGVAFQSGNIYIYNGRGADSIIYSPIFLTANSWQLFTVVFNGSEAVNSDRLKVYLNDTRMSMSVLNTFNALSPDLGADAIDIELGTIMYHTTYASATFDEFRVYNYALNSTEVANLYNNSLTTFYSSGSFSLTNQSYLNITPGVNKVNVSTSYNNFAGTTINISLSYYDGVWHSLPAQTLSGGNTFDISLLTTNLTINYTFASNENMSYTPNIFGNINVTTWLESSQGLISCSFTSNNWLFVNVTASDVNLRWINISYYDASLAKIWTQNYTVPIGVSSENLSYNLSGLADGLYWFNATAVDWANNANYTASCNVTIDTLAPQIGYVPITEINNSYFARSDINVNVSVNETNFANVTIYLYNSTFSLINSTTNTTSLNHSVNFTTYGDGVYYFNATAYDNASNSNSTYTYTVTLDTINPNITFVSPTESAPYTFTQNSYIRTATNVSDINFANTSVNLYTLAGTLINVTNSTNNLFYLNYSGVGEGIYLFNATTFDYARNTNKTDTRMIGVDLNNPIVAYVLDTPAHMSFVTHNWTIVNITTADTFNTSTFLDFNHDQLLYYSFSNWSGNTVGDDSSYRRNGTLNNSVVVSNLYPTRGDNANFSGGNNDAINLSSSFLTGLSEVTFSFYARASVSAGHDGGLFTAQPADGVERFGIRYDALGANGGASNVITYALTTSTTVWSAETVANQQTSGDWQHIALTWQRGGSPKLYINGTFIATSWNTSDTLDGTLLANDTLLIGDGAQDVNWNGRIDEFMIFNRTLDASEIAALVNSNSTITTSYLANITNLVDANYSYNGCAQDISGRWGCLANRSVVIDTIRPNISFIAPTEVPDANLSRTWVVLNTTANDTNLANITLRLYTGAGTLINTSNVSALNAQTLLNGLNFSELADGVYLYNATATDLAGWTNDTATYNFTIDTVAPAIDFITPTPLTGTNWTGNYTQINVSAIDVNLHNITILLYNSSGDLINSSSAFGVAASPFFYNFTDLIDGVYYFNATAYDTAGNYNFTETRNVTIDTIRPNISFVTVTDQNATNLSRIWIDINVSITDVNIRYSNITIYNSSFELIWVQNSTIANNTLNFTTPYDGIFYFNATALDWAGWTNFTPTWQVNVTGRAVQLELTNITFSNSTAIEGQNITAYINVSNLGINNATNVTVQLNLSLWNGTRNLLYTYNFTEFNVTANSSIALEYNWTVQVGTFEFSAMVDPENKFMETNESDNTFARNYTTSVWTIYYGLFDYDLFLGDFANRAIYNWSAYGTMFTTYYADIDSVYNAADLYAFNQTDDFNQTDIILNVSGYNDSVRALFDVNDDGIADQTITATLGGVTITDIPIINSTITSDFITGILWDKADSPANYDGSQDLVFITFTNYSKVGQYGTYDYEIRIPSALRKLVASTDYVERVVEVS